jgi:hypothetical protein
VASDVHRSRVRHLNRLLILLSVVALLGGLLLGQWQQVLTHALFLCFSCMGLG